MTACSRAAATATRCFSRRSMGSAPPRRANAVELGLDGAGLDPEPRTQCLSQPCSIPAPMVVPMEESPATRIPRTADRVPT